MISPKEVQKGSIVSYEGKTRIVKGVMDYIILEGTKEWIGGSLIEGEPLNEQWLDRLGFGKPDEGTWSNGVMEVHLIDGHFESQFSPVHLLYIHQLQLQYFALTWEHLKIPKIKQ